MDKSYEPVHQIIATYNRRCGDYISCNLIGTSEYPINEYNTTNVFTSMIEEVDKYGEVVRVKMNFNYGEERGTPIFYSKPYNTPTQYKWLDIVPWNAFERRESIRKINNESCFYETMDV
jgi:hypothetical protein